MGLSNAHGCAQVRETLMIRKLLPLALAAAPLLAISSGVHAQQSNDLRMQPPGQQAQPGQETPGAQASSTTSTCRFTNGPRKGSTVDFSATPGVAAVPIGSQCRDMTGSSGAAVAPESNRTPGAGRFYRTPEAPVGMDRSGQPTAGYTLTCRFSSGPNAGNIRDFSGTLGATPIRIGSTCSDGGNKGVGVAPAGSQAPQGPQGPQGPGGTGGQ
jgi:hypothetical protein